MNAGEPNLSFFDEQRTDLAFGRKAMLYAKPFRTNPPQPSTIPRSTMRAAIYGLVAALCGTTLGCGSSDPLNGTLKCGDKPPSCPEGYDCLAGHCWRKGTGPSLDGSAVSLDGSFDTGAADWSAQIDANLGMETDAGLDGLASNVEASQSVDNASDAPLPDVGYLDVPLSNSDAVSSCVGSECLGNFDLGVPSQPVDGASVSPPEVGRQDAFPLYVDVGQSCPGTGCPGDAGSGPSTCTQRSYDDTTGIFVLASSAAGANCGDRLLPCQTIGQGIALAKSLGRTIVYVGAGTYTESISLVPGIRIEGAWSVLGSTWSPICTSSADSVIIEAPSSANTTISAKNLAGSAALAFVTVKSKATSVASESLYGVFASGATTHLTLDNVEITMANAGAGQDGQSGHGGLNGSSSGCSPAGSGAPGAASGTPGADGSPAGFDGNGYTAGDGSVGTNGQAGSAGPAGAAGTCVRNCGICGSTSASSCSSAPDSCGTDSLAGCPGGPGTSGGAGLGGGSSIAMYAWDATVTVVGGNFRAGNGGKGGVGGLGGQGGIGQPGRDGKDATACYQCSISSQWVGTSPSIQVYQCVNSPIGTGVGGVANGIGGGNGTAGGDGGSGAGGSSFAVYTGGLAKVGTTSDTVLSFGQAGAGGGSAIAGSAKAIGP